MCSYQTIFSLVSLNSRNTYLHALYTKKSLFFENSSRREGKEKKEIENDEARKAESWKIQRYALF